MSKKIVARTTILTAAAALASIALTGCGMQSGSVVAPPGSILIAAMNGQVHGGQQPVSGATIQLYAAGAGGYGTAATPLIGTTVLTDANGGFGIGGTYTCPANSQVYLVATGGNPGLGAGQKNNNLAMMAALGPCSALSSSTFISVNELTTVASVWPLARFMTGYATLATSTGNATGLNSAFAAVNKVANIASGALPGTTLPTGATLPVAEINTLADILATCINSAGGTAGDGTNCGKLFTAATPPGGTAPTDTVAAAINIARNPSSNITALFNMSSPSAPFQPTLTAAPTNFLIGINYVGGGLSTPKGLAVDAAGNIWLANSGNSSITELNSTGTALSPAAGFTGGGLSVPVAIAVDLSGNVWAANSTGNSVSKFSSAGTPVAAAGYTGGGLSTPRSISIDGTGNVWVANGGNSSVTELSSAGVAISPAGGYTGAGVNSPTGIAVNPH